jgi:protein gp37
MGLKTGIAWTHSTFNPWRGCQRVSPGCEHCYAETLSKRNHALLGQWGPPASGGTRVIASASMWREPLRWNAEAAKTGREHRVFCSSLADVFEDLRELDEPRQWLWALIHATPGVAWLLLTKRPGNVLRMVPRRWWTAPDGETPSAEHWPRNVWVGTTVEDQPRADERIPLLLDIPAPVRFLSVEPQLEHVSLSGHHAVEWVIQGGESGPHARPFDLAWARSLRDQCATAGVPYFFKQYGANTVRHRFDGPPPPRGHIADPDWFAPDLRIQQVPEVRHAG